MNSRKEISQVTAGIPAKIAVSNPAPQAAVDLIASPSSQRFCVNEQCVNLGACEIGGSNYVKLRDIGQAAGFCTTYDAVPTPSPSTRTSLMKWRQLSLQSARPHSPKTRKLHQCLPRRFAVCSAGG